MTSTKTRDTSQPTILNAQPVRGAPTVKPTVVTLEQLSKELDVSPRDARMLLRLAAKQTKQYPNLGKEHVARQPWQWTVGSKALDEARKALTTAEA